MTSQSHQSGMTSATRMRCADELSRSTRARRCVVVAHAPLSAQPRVARATAVTRRHRKRLQNSRLRLPLSNDSRAASACRRERSGRTSTRFCRGRRDSVKHHLFLDPFTLIPTSSVRDRESRDCKHPDQSDSVRYASYFRSR